MPSRRLTLAHGFTQNARCWGPFADLLSRDTAVHRIDLPGHGDVHDDAASLAEAGDLLLAAGGEGHYLGYSMGGRIALHAALQDAALQEAEADERRMHSLVVIGATAGITRDVERAARRDADEVLARRLDGGDVSGFVDAWLGNEMFAAVAEPQQCRAERYRNRAAGLAASLRHRGTGSQEPLHDRLGSLSLPVLVVVGEHDAKFLALGQDVCDAVGDNAELAVVAGAGHAAHLEQPQVTADLIGSWLDAL